MTKAFKEYKNLDIISENLIKAGMNSQDRTIQKILRRQWKLLKKMTREEFEAAMFEDNVYFW